MSQNCYGCRFALEARNHVRHGEQVRCAKAEELFGGERWVNVRRSEKTGRLLKPKCGQFQEFVGDNSRVPDHEKPARKVMKACQSCKGSGMTKIQFVSGAVVVKCYKCKGKGKIPVDNS
jgi:hypothetical protein